MKTIYLANITYPQQDKSVVKFLNKNTYDNIIVDESKHLYRIIDEIEINGEVREYVESLENNYEPAARIDDASKRIPMLIKHFETEIKALESLNNPAAGGRVSELENHIKDLKKKIK